MHCYLTHRRLESGLRCSTCAEFLSQVLGGKATCIGASK